MTPIMGAQSVDFSFSIVEMLGRSNYLALVGTMSNPKFQPNKVVIWDDSVAKIAIELEFKSAVFAVKLTKER